MKPNFPSITFPVDLSTKVSVENELRLPRINFLFTFPDEIRGMLTITKWNSYGSDWKPTQDITSATIAFV